MASFGKKILSAFVDITEEKKSVVLPEEKRSTSAAPAATVSANSIEKFKQYFDKLFNDANLPGPDYFEFAKMTQAMLAIADEKARYSAAYAGLSIQGLDKNKLLDTATAYLKILETDAANFSSTVDAALAEKVQAKQQEMVNKQQRVEQLSREITDLQHQIQLLCAEVKENEEKIESNTGGYKAAAANMQQQILLDIERIKQHIS
jgi:hypothetical protein